MASCFKGTCMIYWVIWLVCLAYYMGTAIFTSHYIMTTDATHLVFTYLKLVCLFNIGFCFVGCIFLKCSITHVLCAFLFVFPLLGVNLAGCILGISASRKVIAPTSKQVIKNILESLRDTMGYPIWFENSQYWLGCCGVYSYLDYPFLFGNFTSNQLSSLIPSTCCPEKMGNPECNRNLGNVTSVVENHNKTGGMKASEILAELKQKCGDMQEDIPYEFNTSLVIHSVKNINNIISPCGCIDKIATMTDGLIQSHFIFFLILLLMSLIMAVVYLKAWCKHNGDNTDSGSQHSLDIDEPPTVHAMIAASTPEVAPPIVRRNPHASRNLSVAQQLRSGSVAESSGPPASYKIPKKIKAETNLRKGTVIGGVHVTPSAKAVPVGQKLHNSLQNH